MGTSYRLPLIATSVAGFLALGPPLLLYAYGRWGSKEGLTGKALGHGLADTGA